MTKKGTTFRTSKGVVVSVAYPDIYIQPGFVLPADVTNPSEMREELKSLSENWRLLYYDNFDSPNLHVVRFGAGGVIERHTLRAFKTSSGCLQLKTDAVIGSNPQVNTHIGGFIDKKILIRTVFAGGTNLDEFTGHFPCWDKDWTGYKATFKLLRTGAHNHLDTLQINTPAGYVTIASWGTNHGLWCHSTLSVLVWHTVDLVLDYLNRKYVSITVDGEVFDLSKYNLVPESIFEPANMPLRWWIVTNEAVAKYAWIGEIVVLEVT